MRAPRAQLGLDLAADRAAVRAASLHFARRRGRDERVAVDLAVRMVDRRADLAAAVLEHEHVLDLGPGEQRLGALGPEVDDLAHLLDAEASRATRRARARTARPRTRRPRARTSRPRPRRRRGRSARPARARASGSGTSARRTDRALRGRRRRTGSRRSGRFGRAWRWPTMLTHSPVSGSKRSSPSGGRRRRDRSSRRHTCRMRRAEPTPDHGIRKMTVDDCPAVAAVQARAFFDDPLQVWALPDASTRLSILEQVFELLSRYSSVPRGESYTDASLSSAAFWVPPGPFELDRAGGRGDGADARSARRRQRPVPRRRRHDARAPPDASCTSTSRASAPTRRARAKGSRRPRCSRCSRVATRTASRRTSRARRNATSASTKGTASRSSAASTIPLDGPPLWLMWRAPR